MKKEINVGLCEARHPMPVSEYIFPNTIENPHNYAALNRVCAQWIRKNCDIHTTIGVPLNGLEETTIFTSDVRVNLYVTGLSMPLAAFEAMCAMNGVGLTLMHYDKETGEYKAQPLF